MIPATMTARRMLTTDDGPVFTSERTLRALLAIRREKLLEPLYGPIHIARSVVARLPDAPDRLTVVNDAPDHPLPPRVEAAANTSDQATLRAALAHGASLVLLDGPAKEPTKLSFIKAEGAVSILVAAYRQGQLSAVRPMIKALRALGFEDVLPPPESLDALYEALDDLGS
jgi:predicted nucleic acid-binding protein